MKRIGAPMIGGIFSSFLLELTVYPPLYEIWLGRWNLEEEFELASEMAGESPARRYDDSGATISSH